MYIDYEGPLYLLRRTSDNATKAIGVKQGTGFADADAQQHFCPPSTICTVERIFDQSPNGNHLDKVQVEPNNTQKQPVSGINAMRDALVVGGHTVYSAYFEGGQGQGSRSGTMGFKCTVGNGTAVDEEPQTVYMVTAGKHWNHDCCFDYGNSDGSHMEAVHWSGMHGGSDHPGSDGGKQFPVWAMADFGNGRWAGDKSDVNPTNTPIDAQFVTAMLKGKSDGFTLKGGDAQAGGLQTLFDGPRPAGYETMGKKGAIVLGVGQNNNDHGIGTFYEGAMTKHYTSNQADSAVHASIVAAGYGRSAVAFV